jgi:hypothetical protein
MRDISDSNLKQVEKNGPFILSVLHTYGMVHQNFKKSGREAINAIQFLALEQNVRKQNVRNYKVYLNGVPVLCSWHKTKSHVCPNRHLLIKWLILGRMATKKTYEVRNWFWS